MIRSFVGSRLGLSAWLAASKTDDLTLLNLVTSRRWFTVLWLVAIFPSEETSVVDPFNVYRVDHGDLADSCLIGIGTELTIQLDAASSVTLMTGGV